MRYWIFATVALAAFACNSPEPQSALPIIGNHDIQGEDTIYHQIPDFAYIDQDSQMVTNAIWLFISNR